ncbi:(d)CMP kinase, partial [Acinetobacter baumannii]|nr:(d)CMP kinase [Acinetobacter baumannii]
IDQYGAVITTTYVWYDGTFNQWINLSQYQTQNLSIVVKDQDDKRDMEREVAPLKPAADAYIIDSSELTIDQVFKLMVDYVN